jgi:hypothetical protein
MPFRSKKQQRWMFAAESRGELPEGTAHRWADETDFKELPEQKEEQKEEKKQKKTAECIRSQLANLYLFQGK